MFESVVSELEPQHIAAASQKESSKDRPALKPIHSYEVWDGVRNFYCGGKLHIGPNQRNLIIVILLINVTNAISLSFSWIDYARVDGNLLPLVFGLPLWILVNFYLYKAATSDPGLIPKQADDDHSRKWRSEFKNYLVIDGLNGQKAFVTRLKFCYSCMIFRPKRSVHCRQCNVCVEMFDHHCPFISNCIGKRNYVFFWSFINLLWINLVFTIAVASHDIRRRRIVFQQELDNDTAASYGETFKNLPLAPLVLIFCAFVLVILTALVVYHCYLGATFQTTYEERKNSFKNYFWRPYNTGSCRRNLKERIFTKKSAAALFDPLQKHAPELQNF